MFHAARPFNIWGGEQIKPPSILIIHHTADLQDEQADAVQKEHAARGYSTSSMGSNVCYHFMVGKDGTVKQFRSIYERDGCTRNGVANAEAIQIVVAGNFQLEQPTKKQLDALEALIRQLDATYHFKEISGHEEYSPTACPGINLINDLKHDGLWRAPAETQIWYITRYYSPEAGQKKYFRNGTGAYLADVKMNCGLNADGSAGDCLTTASGYKLKKDDAFKIVACPPEIPFHTKMELEGVGVVICEDRGGAIKDHRLDLWAGIGMEAISKLKTMPSGYLRVTFLKN